MKCSDLIFLSILLVSSRLWALTSVCLPEGEGYRSWPVQAIYLHGLFPDGIDDLGFRALEMENREKLKQLALKLQIRIAIPVGLKSPIADEYSWNRLNLSQILDRSRKACPSSEFKGRPTLIGFSNGGYKAREIALRCDQAEMFARIFSIGAPKNLRNSSCGGGHQLLNIGPHIFPDLQFFELNW